MTRPKVSLGPAYFARIYADDPDPWRFETSDYERDKYRLTLQSLPRPRYRSAFEIGCSIGILTRKLAERCDRLLAIDLLDEVLEGARKRLHHQRHVRLERMKVPDELPNEVFDLVVVSEVGYYLSTRDLDRLLIFLHRHLETGGHLIAVHWTLPETDYPLTGDQVHERILAMVGSWHHLRADRRRRFRLDLLERCAPF